MDSSAPLDAGFLAPDHRVDVLSLLEKISTKRGRGPLASRCSAIKKLSAYSKAGFLMDGLGKCPPKETGGKSHHVFHQGRQGVQELNALFKRMPETKQRAFEGLRCQVERYILTPVGTPAAIHHAALLFRSDQRADLF